MNVSSLDYKPSMIGGRVFVDSAAKPCTPCMHTPAVVLGLVAKRYGATWL